MGGYFGGKNSIVQLVQENPRRSGPDMWIGGNLFVGDYDDDARHLEMGSIRFFRDPLISVFTAALGDFIGARHSAVENACQ